MTKKNVKFHPSVYAIKDGFFYIKANNSPRWHKFDMDFYTALKGKAWRENAAGYLVTSMNLRTYKASRWVVGRLKKGMHVGYKDLDRTNNTRENLILCTSSQINGHWNMKESSSGYRGVWWSKGHKKWSARLTVKGKRYNLGYDDDPKVMARIYDRYAVRHLGETAITNHKLGLLIPRSTPVKATLTN